MERDRESNAKLAAEQAVKEMLPVFENLERIAAAINDPESGMAKGMAMVIRQFSDGLCKLGLEFIPTEGPFDPALHEPSRWSRSTTSRRTVTSSGRSAEATSSRAGC